MKHDPDDPKVKASYEALAKETLAQWQAIKKTGLKVEWIKPDQDDPYATTPRLGEIDVLRNNHWYGFPTDQGFGTGEEAKAAEHNNPMLQPTDEVIDGRSASSTTFSASFTIISGTSKRALVSALTVRKMRGAAMLRCTRRSRAGR